MCRCTALGLVIMPTSLTIFFNNTLFFCGPHLWDSINHAIQTSPLFQMFLQTISNLPLCDIPVVLFLFFSLFLIIPFLSFPFLSDSVYMYIVRLGQSLSLCPYVLTVSTSAMSDCTFSIVSTFVVLSKQTSF